MWRYSPSERLPSYSRNPGLKSLPGDLLSWGFLSSSGQIPWWHHWPVTGCVSLSPNARSTVNVWSVLSYDSFVGRYVEWRQWRRDRKPHECGNQSDGGVVVGTTVSRAYGISHVTRTFAHVSCIVLCCMKAAQAFEWAMWDMRISLGANIWIVDFPLVT
jgi:hypothetical protein